MEQSWCGKMRSKHWSKVRIWRENSVHDKYTYINFFLSKVKLLLHNVTYFFPHLCQESSAFWKISGLILTCQRVSLSYSTYILPNAEKFSEACWVWKVWSLQEEPLCFDGLWNKPLLRRCPGTGPERACSEPNKVLSLSFLCMCLVSIR